MENHWPSSSRNITLRLDKSAKIYKVLLSDWLNNASCDNILLWSWSGDGGEGGKFGGRGDRGDGE